MKALWLISSLLALMLAGCGESDAPAPAGPVNTSPGAIIGIVLQNDGKPARQLELRLITQATTTTPAEGETQVSTMTGGRFSLDGPDVVTLQTVKTDSSGAYRLESVPPGRYMLVTDSGKGGVWFGWVNVAGGSTVQQNITLGQR